MAIFAKNKKAYFNYEILEKWEAGIVLSGGEVKSVKNGQLNLKGGFVGVDRGEAWLESAHISRYRLSSETDYNPKRKRKLLLRKKQIEKIAGLLNQKGITVVPLEVYGKGSLIKVLIGLGRGKKKYDKREKIKERIAIRDAERAAKHESRK